MLYIKLKNVYTIKLVMILPGCTFLTSSILFLALLFPASQIF